MTAQNTMTASRVAPVADDFPVRAQVPARTIRPAVAGVREPAQPDFRAELFTAFRAHGLAIGPADTFGRTKGFYRRAGGDWTRHLR